MSTLFGVGVGPGDPELLTLKAVRIIRAAPVVAYPAPLEGPGMARSIAAAFVTPGTIELPLRMSFDLDRVSANAAYDAGALAIADHLTAGRDVAVLCEGDPFFFGSFIHLFGRLCDRFAVEVVPGVTSVAACGAALKFPLAALDDRVAIIPAGCPEDELERLLAGVDAAAIIKAGRHLAKLVRVLERLGLVDRARYIERAGLPDQRIRPLAAAAADGGTYFSMVLVHNAAEPQPKRFVLLTSKIFAAREDF
ncbi:MAG: precorrin-2 C(20)-methyltransferase [Alphaproteobacteria bacterium]